MAEKPYRPLTADVIYIYDGQWSEYPETVKILMTDGHYMSYRLDVKQPKPQLVGMLDQFKAVCVGGYKYKEKGKGKLDGTKKEIGGASSQDK